MHFKHIVSMDTLGKLRLSTFLDVRTSLLPNFSLLLEEGQLGIEVAYLLLPSILAT